MHISDVKLQPTIRKGTETTFEINSNFQLTARSGQRITRIFFVILNAGTKEQEVTVMAATSSKLTLYLSNTSNGKRP